jgi:pyridoxine 5'-phosphate synthase PdxJ
MVLATLALIAQQHQHLFTVHLRVATRHGQTAVVQLLHQHGANANAERVAVEAAYQGHTDILRLLIGSGLDLARWGADLIE